MNVQVEASPFVTMWLHPRRTMRRIERTSWESWAIPIAMLASAAGALVEISQRKLDLVTGLGFDGYAAVAAVGGFQALGAVVWVLVYGWLLSFSGEWLGGEAETEKTRAAIGWSQLPGVLVVPVGLLFVGMYGPSAPIYAASPVNTGGSLVMTLTGFITIITAIWVVVLTVASVREVQGFTVLRAIANLVIAALLPLTLLVVGGILYFVFTGL